MKGLKIGLSLTAASRPDYLRQVLDSWLKVQGNKSVDWVFRVEPIRTDVIQMVHEFPMKKQVYVNARVEGALGNPYLALQDGFVRGNDFVILGEDDSIVSPDILQYFRQMAMDLEDEKSTFAVCGFTHTPHSEREDEYFFRPYFASCVWGTWRDRWEKWMEHKWDFDYSSGGWDHRFVQIIQSEGLNCVFPSISRVQHIGQYDGVHMKPEDYDSLKAQRFLEQPTAKTRKLFKGAAP